MSSPNDRQPATRADLAALKAELLNELTAALLGAEARITERTETRIERMETTMLREFHGYAQGTAARLKALDVGETALKERVAALEDRVLELEARIRPQH